MGVCVEKQLYDCLGKMCKSSVPYASVVHCIHNPVWTGKYVALIAGCTMIW